MKNFRILVMLCAFIMSSPMQAFLNDFDIEGLVVALIGAGVGSGAAAVLGAQKGAIFGKLYAKSLGSLAEATGAVFGGVVAIIPGAFVGAMAGLAMRDIAKYMRKKIANARRKLQELFISSDTVPQASLKPDQKIINESSDPHTAF